MGPFHLEFRPGHEMKTTWVTVSGYLHHILNPRNSAFLVLVKLLALFNTMTIHGIFVDHSYLLIFTVHSFLPLRVLFNCSRGEVVEQMVSLPLTVQTGLITIV